MPTKLPSVLHKRFIGSADLAKLLDKPCAEHAGTKLSESSGCPDCDRWSSERALRFMRRRDIAIELPEPGRGKRVTTTFAKLLELEGFGDVIMRKLTSEELRKLID